MTTYHVAKTGNNANNGLSLSTAFLTIQHAHNVSVSGDVITVHPGAYNEKLYIYTPGLTVQGSDPNNKPVIWHAASGDYDYVVRISRHCVFQYFEVHGALKNLDQYPYQNRGIEAGGESGAVNTGHITIRGCEVHHTGSAAILVHYQDGLLVEDCEVHTAALANYNGVFASANQWWPGGNSFTRGANYVIRNNHVWGVWGEGLPFDFGVINISCYGNVVGQTWSGKIYLGEVKDAYVHGNFVFTPEGHSRINDGPHAGLGLTDESYTANQIDIDNVHFYNNIAVDCSSGIWLAHGHDEHNTKNVYFYNNTIIALREGHAAFRMFSADYQNVNVTNNIFYAASNASITAGNLSTTVNFERNLWNVIPDNLARDINDIIGDPQLVAPETPIVGDRGDNIDTENYKITATSPAINKGNSDVDLDFFGNTRSGNPDLGAHEFETGPPNPVQANFSIGAGEETGDVPHTVNFNSESSAAPAGIASHLWDFGDGNQSEEANPTHTYETAGAKTVKLTIFDTAGNSDTVIKENFIVVTPPITPTSSGSSIAYYKFEEGSGAVIKDHAETLPALDLTIEDMTAVEWLEKGLKINAPTVIKSLTAAEKIINACQATHEVSIEIWIKPANDTQNGPSRIVSISQDIYQRNITLGQGGANYPGNTSSGDFYTARLRTTDTDANGRPAVATAPGTLEPELQHVVYTRNMNGGVKIYVNNQVVLNETVTGQLINWDLSYPLYLANENGGERSWVGELHMVKIYASELSAGDVEDNFELGPHAELNAAFTIGEDEDLGSIPHIVNFDASASSGDNAIESYTWDFGDNSTGSGQVVSHEYTEKGEFYPSLTIKDELGNTHTATREFPIIVLEPEIDRIEEELQVLYTFLEGDGNVIQDISPGDDPLDLKIDDETAVTWLPTGLRINQSVKITSQEPAKKIIDACKANNEITLEAWIQPARENQTGPARIVTISKNLVERYATLAQGLWGNQPGNLYDIRLRRDPAKGNGTPSFSSEEGSVKTELTHVAFTWDANTGKGKIYLDGELHKTKEMPGSFSSWNDGYFDLNLANEATGGRIWLGDMYLVAVYAKALNAAEITKNFQAGIPLRPQIPENFKRFILLHPHYDPAEDTANLIAYGAQYPDMQCALLWEGNSEFEIMPNIDTVTETYPHVTLRWLDE